MKKFIIVVSLLVAFLFAADYLYYYAGLYVDLKPEQPVETFTKVEGKDILLNAGEGYKPFHMKGMDMGVGIPTEWATDFAIDRKTYLRWFQMIQDMGANVIRVYTVQGDDFYNAFYEYNRNNPNPLWMLQGVWVNDYIQNSYRDAFHEDYYAHFMRNCRDAVDVIHGNKKIQLGRQASSGTGFFTKDVSPWVIGYILGVEWEDVTVAFTDEQNLGAEHASFSGKYLYTTPDAAPFEAMLAMVGDDCISYESKRYKTQRLVAFSNWPTTDPFDYPIELARFFEKCAKVDTEHIKGTDQFLSGMFASYHVYPYYPDYLQYMTNDAYWKGLNIGSQEDYLTAEGKVNTYLAYLTMLNRHHTMPVVISEFGVSTGRGMAQIDANTNRNQGNMSEQEQGQAIIDCYRDIMAAGCNGGCIFSWQDEWFKRTWNTMYAVDLMRTPYWSDYQTNEQYFGLLSFDPGKEKSICYVDGDVSEWTEKDIVADTTKGELSFKYDEKFLYFMVHVPGLQFGCDTIYIPLDVTPNSGTFYSTEHDLRFEEPADFLLVIHGREDSRLLVQERYEALRSTYAMDVKGFDTYVAGNIPDVDSPLFLPVNMILRMYSRLPGQKITDDKQFYEVFETGLLTYGNANPEAADFNSLADFICQGDNIEIKLPWQLLNFGDPSRMKIHDDYYDGNYGVELIPIDHMNAGLCVNQMEQRIPFAEIPLKGWQNGATYHERLKSSYGMVRELWGKGQ